MKDKIYLIFLALTIFLAYGFSAANVTIGIDDLECDRYIGADQELLAAGRFSWVFWTKLFGFKNRYVENNFIFEMAGAVLLAWAAVNFCILLKKASGDKLKRVSYCLFSCILVSYPLMNEIWEYTGVNIAVCGAICFVSFALLFMRSQMHHGFCLKQFAAASLLLMIVCAGYESVAVVYVFGVCMLLFVEMSFEKECRRTFRELIRQGAFYAGALAAGVMLRVIVHHILLAVLGLGKVVNGETGIRWGTVPTTQILSDIVRGIVKNYVIRGIIYFPITELVVCVAVFLFILVILCRYRKNKLFLLPAIGMLISLIFLTLLQGIASPYRTCQVFAFFVAAVVSLSVHYTTTNAKRMVRGFGIVLAVGSSVLCIHQVSTMNYYLTANYLRSEEEARVICNIGQKLGEKYDSEKPVIFTGSYELSENTKQRVMIEENDPRWKIFSKAYGLFSDKDIYHGEEFRKLPDTNVNSVINWAMSAWDSQESLEKLFRYYGYEYHAADYSLRDEAEEYVQEYGVPAFRRIRRKAVLLSRRTISLSIWGMNSKESNG